MNVTALSRPATATTLRGAISQQPTMPLALDARKMPSDQIGERGSTTRRLSPRKSMHTVSANTTWRQHTLFQFLAEDATATAHANETLGSRVSAMEEAQRSLKEHIEHLEDEKRYVESRHRATVIELQQRISHDGERRDDLLRYSYTLEQTKREREEELSTLRKLIVKDLNELPCSNGDDAAETAPSDDTPLVELVEQLERRRAMLSALRDGEKSGLAMGVKEAAIVDGAIEGAMGLIPKPKDEGVDESTWSNGRNLRARRKEGGNTESEPTSEVPAVLFAARLAVREAIAHEASEAELLTRAERAASDERGSGRSSPVPSAAMLQALSTEAASGVPAEELAAEAMEAALSVGKLNHAPIASTRHAVEEALKKGFSAHEAAAAGIGSASVELTAVGAAAAYRAAITRPDASPLACAAAAHAACLVSAAGGEVAVASSAGAHAASCIANGETLEQVHAFASASAATLAPFDERRAAAEGMVQVPAGWSVGEWLKSIRLEDVVADALTQRLRSMTDPAPSQPYELPFLLNLAASGGVDAIAALLKETPVLIQIATLIFDQIDGMATTRREAEEAAAEEAAAEVAAAEAVAEAAAVTPAAAPAGAPAAPLAPADGNEPSTNALALDTVGRKKTSILKSLARAVAFQRRSKVHSPLMTEFVNKPGAPTLFFSKDASLYWAGVVSLVGPPRPNSSLSLLEAIEHEHVGCADADVIFEARNYQTRTSSRLEYCFVARPEELPNLGTHLAELGLPKGQWPSVGSISETKEDDELRHTRTYEQFGDELRKVNAQLVAYREQPLSFVEFVALRAYTGPLFVKYNNVLRAGCGIGFFVDFVHRVCKGNRYPTTIHVLSAAIVKLGKITGPPRLVYRAPGGALPDDFYKRSRNGTIGILEAGCLSTSADKHEAVQYALRADAKVIFEVNQGFVARGASISWLSQYPTEAEILFPPMTALEVTGSRIEGEMMVLCLQPAAPRECIKCGAEDIIKEEEARRVSEEAAASAKAAEAKRQLQQRFGAVLERKRAAKEAWQVKLQQCQRAATRAKVATLEDRLIQGQTEMAKLRMVSEMARHVDAMMDAEAKASAEAERKKLHSEKERLEAALKVAHAEMEAAREAAKLAQQSEAQAATLMRYQLAQDNPHLARTVAGEIIRDAAGVDARAKRRADGAAQNRGDDSDGASDVTSEVAADVAAGGPVDAAEGGAVDGAGYATGPPKLRTAPTNASLKRSSTGTLSLRTANFDALLTPLQEAVDSHEQTAVTAVLERIVELTMADKKVLIIDEMKAPYIRPVVKCIQFDKDNVLMVLASCCALACLTKSKAPYPRKIQDAAAEAGVVPALLAAITVLGEAFDHPAREALRNTTKNDKKLTDQAVRGGATWLVGGQQGMDKPSASPAAAPPATAPPATAPSPSKAPRDTRNKSVKRAVPARPSK